MKNGSSAHSQILSRRFALLLTPTSHKRRGRNIPVQEKPLTNHPPCEEPAHTFWGLLSRMFLRVLSCPWSRRADAAQPPVYLLPGVFLLPMTASLRPLVSHMLDIFYGSSNPGTGSAENKPGLYQLLKAQALRKRGQVEAWAGRARGWLGHPRAGAPVLWQFPEPDSLSRQ